MSEHGSASARAYIRRPPDSLSAGAFSVTAEYEAETQREYRKVFSEELDKREQELEEFIKQNFGKCISRKDELVIDLPSLAVNELAQLISLNPSKMIRILFRITGASPRSVARDLRISVNSEPRTVSTGNALKLASYFRELVPPQFPVRAILFHDRIQRENELIRRRKAHWESDVRKHLNGTGFEFKKRRFKVKGKIIEIDCAYPTKGDPAIAVDVKRIEALQDYQKRTDEINGKARDLKTVYRAVFIACIFFPFSEKRQMVRNRLDESVVDRTYFQDEISNMATDIKQIAQRLGMIGT